MVPRNDDTPTTEITRDFRFGSFLKWCKLPELIVLISGITAFLTVITVPGREFQFDSQVEVLSKVAALIFGLAALLGLLAYLKHREKKNLQRQLVPEVLSNSLQLMQHGLLVLDDAEQVVFANDSFLKESGYLSAEIMGLKLSALKWVDSDGDRCHPAHRYPWHDTIENGVSKHGVVLNLNQNGHRKVFSMTTSPFIRDDGKIAGAFVGLEEMSRRLQRTEDFTSAIQALHETPPSHRRSDSDSQTNHLDPLTGCYLRHAFFEQLEKHWHYAQQTETPLSCLLINLDQFRQMNHQLGQIRSDLILEKTSEAIRQHLKPSSVISRFGGDEFAVLLPQYDREAAIIIADKLLKSISQISTPDINVTASIGVAAHYPVDDSFLSLIEQADESLLAAKERGRNRWVCFDSSFTYRKDKKKDLNRQQVVTPPLSFPAVAALVSALAYRDERTAAHSRRVADLCLAIGQSLMSPRECYVLETAALLHDIGKIGIPDSILQKPAALDEHERNIMRSHDRFGLDIIQAAFSSEGLEAIIRNYSKPYHELKSEVHEIPLGASILAVADAYDSMCSDQIYRPKMSHQQAIEELQKCSGSQFDPQIVHKLIEILDPSASNPSENRETVLAMGLQLERLIETLDALDLQALAKLAGKLSAAAEASGSPEIAVKAMELETAASHGTDLLGILKSTHELISYCRAARESILYQSLSS